MLSCNGNDASEESSSITGNPESILLQQARESDMAESHADEVRKSIVELRVKADDLESKDKKLTKEVNLLISKIQRVEREQEHEKQKRIAAERKFEKERKRRQASDRKIAALEKRNESQQRVLTMLARKANVAEKNTEDMKANKALSKYIKRSMKSAQAERYFNQLSMTQDCLPYSGEIVDRHERPL